MTKREMLVNIYKNVGRRQFILIFQNSVTQSPKSPERIFKEKHKIQYK